MNNEKAKAQVIKEFGDMIEQITEETEENQKAIVWARGRISAADAEIKNSNGEIAGRLVLAKKLVNRLAAWLKKREEVEKLP